MNIPRISATHAKWAHTVAAIGWAAMLPVSYFTGLIYSVAFVSACSIYANCVGHLAAIQGARAEESET